MPVYEYRCESCRRRFSMLNRSFSEIKDPVCTHCGTAGGTRLMSRVSVIKSENDFMGDMASWDAMSDFDENDPRSVADMLRQMKDATGEDIGPEGEELLARMDAGEMMEDIESDMGGGDDLPF